MFNPVELMYIVVFYLYKFLSSKSRTLESVWYRLDGEVFNPELIRIEKHSLLGLFGMTRIINKTTKEREYLFSYLSYQSIINMNKLYDFRNMMVHLKENGKIRELVTRAESNSMHVISLVDTYRPDKYRFDKTTIEIPLGDLIGVLTAKIAFSWLDGKLSIVGIPNDILLMLDGATDQFQKAINTYIKHYHSVSYNLITANR
jgi:hypothetical protein